MSQQKSKIKEQLKSIDRQLSELEKTTDLYQAKTLIEKIETLINNIKKWMDDEEDYGNSQPLLSSELKDLDIYTNKLNKLKDNWRVKENIEKLRDGHLEGADAEEAKRAENLENMKQIDNQGLIVDSIANNIKDANNNLDNINTELNKQGQQLDSIQKKTNEVENEVNKTGKIMTRMEGRAKCIQILAFLAVIFCGLFDIASLVYLIVKKVKNSSNN